MASNPENQLNLDEGLHSKLDKVKSSIKEYPGFPKPPVVFRDWLPIFRDPEVFHDLITVMVSIIRNNFPQLDVIVGLESRGFLIGPILAYQLKKSFVPIRKKNKLPGQVIKASYELEYGTDILELAVESIPSGSKCLLVDDLIATGGSLKAAISLIEQVKAEPIGALVCIELEALKGRDKVKPIPVYSLVQY